VHASLQASKAKLTIRAKEQQARHEKLNRHAADMEKQRAELKKKRESILDLLKNKQTQEKAKFDRWQESLKQLQQNLDQRAAELAKKEEDMEQKIQQS